MTRYTYLQNKVDEIEEIQRHNLEVVEGDIKNNLLQLFKRHLLEDMNSMTIKEASKKAGFFFRLKYR